MNGLYLNFEDIDPSLRLDVMRTARSAAAMLPDDPPEQLFEARVGQAFEAIYSALLNERFQSVGEARDDAQMEERVAHNLSLRAVS